jgi:hypothetical protein
VTANGVDVAQLVRTTWTKRSHGHPMAARRNSVPERLAIPDVPGQRPACIVHRVEYGEVNGFVASVDDKLDVYDEVRSPLNDAVGMYFTGEAL